MLSIKAKKGGGDDGEESFDNDDEDDVDANGGMERNERVVVECRDRYRDRRRGRWVDDYSRRRGIDARGGRGLDDAVRRSMRGMRRRDRCSRRQRDGTASLGRGGDAARHGGRTIVGDRPMAHHAHDCGEGDVPSAAAAAAAAGSTGKGGTSLRRSKPRGTDEREQRRPLLWHTTRGGPTS